MKPQAPPKLAIVVAGAAARALNLERSLLSLHNPRFLSTDSGREAVDLVAQHRPKLCVLSNDLEDLSGAAVARKVRDDPDSRSISILLIDATGQASSAREGGANLAVDASADREAIVLLADRLLSISPRAKTRAAVCIGRAAPAGAKGKGAAVFAQTHDVSESGMLVECQEALETGEDVSLHFVLPGQPELIAAQARVVRVTSGRAGGKRTFGLEYTALLPVHQLRIRRFLRKQSA